jgi:hypothetical protein
MRGIATFVEAAADYAIGAASALVIVLLLFCWTAYRNRWCCSRCTLLTVRHTWSALRCRLTGAPHGQQQAEKADAGDQVSAGEVRP